LGEGVPIERRREKGVPLKSANFTAILYTLFRIKAAQPNTKREKKYTHTYCTVKKHLPQT